MSRAVLYDLSQPIETGMPIFPGDPVPRVSPAGAATQLWLVSRLELGTHTGTHVDAASHFIRGARRIDEYGLDRFVLPAVVVPALGLAEDQPIEEEHLGAALARLPKGGGAIIRTDWSRFWGSERYLRHPYLSLPAAQALVAAGVSLVGIDALNVDSTVQATSHVHEKLMKADILIVENLTRLDQLVPGRPYRFSSLPLRLAGLDGSPVRAVAWEEATVA